MKELLYKISNSLVMLNGQVSKTGLLTGRMGACIMLYHSGRVINSKAYSDMADNMLDELTESLHTEMSLSFSDGLTGIRYGIGHLIDQGFVEADCADLFVDIDEKICSGIASLYEADAMDEYPLYSAGLYLLDRLKGEQDIDAGSETFVLDAIEACKKRFDRDFSLNAGTVLYLNSVLYFLNEVKNRKSFLKASESAIEEILGATIDLLDEKSVLGNDFYITSLLLEPVHRYNPQSRKLSDKLKILLPEAALIQQEIFDINRIWQRLLYFRDMKTAIDKKDIEKQVDERLNAFLDYDPNVLCRELYIMGLHLIKQAKEERTVYNLQID